jgi:hypothetical protein
MVNLSTKSAIREFSESMCIDVLPKMSGQYTKFTEWVGRSWKERDIIFEHWTDWSGGLKKRASKRNKIKLTTKVTTFIIESIREEMPEK